MRVDKVLALTTLTIGAVCFALQIACLISPSWGSFSRASQVRLSDSRTFTDIGYFGPWETCLNKELAPLSKSITYQTFCEPGITEYIPPRLITSAGIMAVVNAVLLCQYIPLAIIHVIKLMKKDDEMIFKTKIVIIFKIILTISIGVLSMCVLGFFAGSKSPTTKFSTDYKWGFYVIVVIVVLSFGLTGITEAEYFIFKRLRDKDMKKRDPNGSRAETYGNPGFEIPRKFGNHLSKSSASHNGRNSQSSNQSSTIPPMSSANHSSDTYLETSFNGIIDRDALRKVDPAMDTGVSFSNPHFASRKSTPHSPSKSIRKDTQV